MAARPRGLLLRATATGAAVSALARWLWSAPSGAPWTGALAVTGVGFVSGALLGATALVAGQRLGRRAVVPSGMVAGAVLAGLLTLANDGADLRGLVVAAGVSAMLGMVVAMTVGFLLDTATIDHGAGRD